MQYSYNLAKDSEKEYKTVLNKAMKNYRKKMTKEMKNLRCNLYLLISPQMSV
jgi:hypothetical protein